MCVCVFFHTTHKTRFSSRKEDLGKTISFVFRQLLLSASQEVSKTTLQHQKIVLVPSSLRHSKHLCETNTFQSNGRPCFSCPDLPEHLPHSLRKQFIPFTVSSPLHQSTRSNLLTSLPPRIWIAIAERKIWISWISAK